MREEVELIESIVPDLIDVLRKRFIILRNIDWSEPVGRRVLAQTLGMSERVLRTETDYLRKQELIASTKSGMILTAKGKRTIQGLSKLMDSLLGLQQMEKELSRYLGIRNCLIVSGDSDRQPLIIEDMGKLVNDILGRELPKGKNVIAAMGGTTMAKVATCLTPKIAVDRDLTFVPARGGIGERLDIQANVVYKIPRIGLQLEDLANMDCIIAVAGGSSKARAIAAYMKNAPEKTYLITDEGAAKMILKG